MPTEKKLLSQDGFSSYGRLERKLRIPAQCAMSTSVQFAHVEDDIEFERHPSIRAEDMNAKDLTFYYHVCLIEVSDKEYIYSGCCEKCCFRFIHISTRCFSFLFENRQMTSHLSNAILILMVFMFILHSLLPSPWYNTQLSRCSQQLQPEVMVTLTNSTLDEWPPRVFSKTFQL